MTSFLSPVKVIVDHLICRVDKSNSLDAKQVIFLLATFLLLFVLGDMETINFFGGRTLFTLI